MCHPVIILSHAFLALTKFGELFSRSTLLTVHVLEVIYLTVLLLSYTSSERSRTFAYSDFPSDSEYIGRPFCWPNRRYCCCCCYKWTSNTLSLVSDYRELSLSVWSTMNRKILLPFFYRKLHFKISTVSVSFFRLARILVPNSKLSHSGGGYGFYPLFFCSCHLSGKVFHKTFLFIPNAP